MAMKLSVSCHIVQTNRIPTQGLKPFLSARFSATCCVQTNRIPTQGLKQRYLPFHHPLSRRPNKQNPDSGIETGNSTGEQRPGSGPNKQNPDSGIETFEGRLPASAFAPVQTNRIPTQGLKQAAGVADCHAHRFSPNKQNPDSGIETTRGTVAPTPITKVQTIRIPTQGLKPSAACSRTGPAAVSKQTESRLRD